MSAVRSLLTDPDEFFGARTDDPSLTGPIAVVTAIALVNGFSQVLEFRAAFGALQSSGLNSSLATAAMTGFSAVAFVFVLAGPFLGWFVWTGAFELVASVLDNDPDFRTTLRFVGWGLAPKVVGALATLALRYYHYSAEGIRVAGASDDVAGEGTREVGQLTGQLATIDHGVTVAVTLASGYLWYHAVRHSIDLDRRDAAIAVGVPVALYLLTTGDPSGIEVNTGSG